ncbi:MAG: ubiquinol-cytochrome C chaperone family protein [Acetobacteraceae bacterium]
MAGLLSLVRKGRYERTGFQLYNAAVAAARDPYLYAGIGIPDTLDGRFDSIGLHVFLLIRRLNREAAPGPALAQAVFDAMFSDMDLNLREMGVTDLGVGRRNKAMWEALHGRATAYTAAWDNDAALEAALARNVWRGTTPAEGAVAALRRLMRAQDAALAGQDVAELQAGRVRYLPGQEAAA